MSPFSARTSSSLKNYPNPQSRYSSYLSTCSSRSFTHTTSSVSPATIHSPTHILPPYHSLAYDSHSLSTSSSLSVALSSLSTSPMPFGTPPMIIQTYSNLPTKIRSSSTTIHTSLKVTVSSIRTYSSSSLSLFSVNHSRAACNMFGRNSEPLTSFIAFVMASLALSTLSLMPLMPCR